MAERNESASKIQHPLAVTRTELVWEGKYDSAGNRVAPLRVALPFQTVETVNESAVDRRHTLELFGQHRQTEWRNRLIWGDKKYVLPSLLAEFAGKVNLIYIDPPFATGADFSFTASVPGYTEGRAGSPLPAAVHEEMRRTEEDDAATSFTKEPSIIEHKAYRDTWGRGLDSYLQWFYETALLLHEVLHETGSLYVHLDWHLGHYAKLVLDEVFGQDKFVNEIIWKRQSAKHGAFGGLGQYGRIHEVILFYTKSESYAWNQQYTTYDEEYIEGFYKFVEPKTNRRFQLGDLTAAEPRRGDSGAAIKIRGERISPPAGRHWAVGLKAGETVQQAVDRLLKDGRIWYEPGKMPRCIRYLDEMKGVMLQDVWTDIRPVAAQSGERLDYATQKPETLLGRIISASSNENDLVLDCFCGSGTTAAVAEKLNRRWITCDLGRFAIHTARKRLLAIPGVRPFIVQNLGKYERQLWQQEQFQGSARASRAAVSALADGSAGGSAPRGAEHDTRGACAPRTEAAEARQRDYVHFILGLYQAKPLNGYSWLHGVKGGRMVHVGAVDAPVSVGDVAQIAAEFKRAIGTGKDAPKTNGVDLLGWDFAFEMNEVAKQQAASANIQVRFLRIPHDAMDKRAVEQGDIHFFELAALSVAAKTDKREVTLKLSDFVIPPDDVPEDVRRSVKHWSQWIDYWAVDWDNKSDTFHNEWQTYRTRNEPKLDLETNHAYAAPGEYTVVVKVIDILGNDTTKTVRVKVK